MKKRWVWLLLMMISSSLQAASFQFAATGDAAPLYQTILDKTVYQYSSQNALKDLAVTNADGESVPYALLPYASVYLQQQVTEKNQDLVIFPMQEQIPDNQQSISIQLQNDDAKLDISSGQTPSKSNNYYLFDLGEQHPAYQKLTLDWEGNIDQLQHVAVKTSDDLKNWETIGHGALIKVVASNQTMIQNTIDLPIAAKARYLQIKPVKPTQTFKLISLSVAYQEIKTINQPMQWQAISFVARRHDNQQTHLEYESFGRYPATQIKINLPQINTITEVQIATRNDHQQPWQYVSTVPVYYLNKQGQDLVNPDIKIASRTARYWRLSFNDKSGGIGQQNPSLALGWLPDVLVWNARGQQPFALHVGEAAYQPNIVSIKNLVQADQTQKLKSLPKVGLTLVSDVQGFNAWKTTGNQTAVWLWGILIIGVLALFGMAYSLLKGQAQ